MGRQLTHRFPTVLSNPEASSGMGTIENRPPTTVSYRIINTMRQAAFWCDATGIVVTETSRHPLRSVDQAFVVEVEYYFERDCRLDPRELLKPLGDRAQDELRQRIATQIDDQKREHKRRLDGLRFTYSIGITEAELEAFGGVVYLQDLDIVVGFDAQRELHYHPHSYSGQRQRLNQSLMEETGAQQRVLIVDNTGRHQQLYMNTGQAILECVTTRDSSLTDGVYVTTRDGLNLVKTQRYSIEEAIETLGLYRSHADAEAYGKPEQRFKETMREAEQSLIEKKQENLLLKQEIEDTKAIQDREKREWEHKVDEDKRRYEHEKTMHERERQTLLDEMEFLKQKRSYTREQENEERKEREHTRKEHTDAWKSLVDVGKAALGIVSVCLSLFVLLQKNAKG